MSVVLLGDSIFRRLLTEYPSTFDLASFQFCVSGAKVQRLWALAKLYRETLKGKQVLLLVGTNNVTSKEAFESIKGYYRSLVRYLKRLSCVVTIVEVLPIPRCERVANVHSVLVQLNKYLRSFEPSGMKVIHTYEKFCVEGRANRSLFVKNYPGGRVDLVHPNKGGLKLLHSILLEEIPSLINNLTI